MKTYTLQQRNGIQRKGPHAIPRLIRQILQVFRILQDCNIADVESTMGSDCHLRDSRHHCLTEKKRKTESIVTVTTRSYRYCSKDVLVKLGCQIVSSSLSNEHVSRFEKFNSESPSSTSLFSSRSKISFLDTWPEWQNPAIRIETLLLVAVSPYDLCCPPFFVQCLLSVFSIRTINTARRNQQFAKIANNVIEEK